MNRITFVYGTRPEIIKLAPILRLLKNTCTIFTGQHRDLVKNVVTGFPTADHNLKTMIVGQTPNQLLANIIIKLEPVLEKEKPRVVVVQGDTTSALAGALCAKAMGIPVAHVEAGLRTYEDIPHPEEMNRRTISSLATYHFCPIFKNLVNLQNEVVFTNPKVKGFVTGSTSVDALRELSPDPVYSEYVKTKYEHCRILLFTMHRRENLDDLSFYTDQIHRFMLMNPGFVCIWPVHPNPAVKEVAERFKAAKNWHLTSPMSHREFITVAKQAWAILSDSGGIQEEITVIRRPLIILRESTERQEVLSLNYVDLAWDTIEGQLEDWKHRLEHNYFVFSKDHIYGDGFAAAKIVNALCTF